MGTLIHDAALLRGVSPMNAKMPELRRSLEAAGFSDVVTVLASGNVVFAAPKKKPDVLAREVEAAMERGMGRSFPVIIRTIDELRAIIDSDPYAAFRLPPGSKRVVTFLRKPPPGKVTLPDEIEGARILCVKGGEAFSVYRPGPRGAVFMTVIEKTFGKEVTTRTWDTVQKIIRAASTPAEPPKRSTSAPGRGAAAKASRLSRAR